MRGMDSARLGVLGVAALLLMGASADVDRQFDRTGDGLVDASDWRRLTLAEQRAYARACLEHIGIAPDARIGGGQTRLDRYLEGLNALYGAHHR